MRKLLALVIALAVFGFVHTAVQAQDAAPYVCRDTHYESGIRYQFRNIPDAWVNQIGYWYVADDGMLDGSTFTADAVTGYQDDASTIKAGEAIVGTSDYSVILRGTADTVPCDPPAESTSPAPQCPAWSLNGETGALFCKWDLPPAPIN